MHVVHGASLNRSSLAIVHRAAGPSCANRRCTGALADYTRAIDLHPQMAEAYNNRAYTEMAQQDYAAALPDLNQAIALRPDYVNALMNRGDIYNYYYDIDFDQAIADYDRVLALDHAHTSVCGHRLLAQHHGWDLGVLATAVTQRASAGCN
jgi:tetratricopeptide (TPR) repeat protein